MGMCIRDRIPPRLVMTDHLGRVYPILGSMTVTKVQLECFQKLNSGHLRSDGCLHVLCRIVTYSQTLDK